MVIRKLAGKALLAPLALLLAACWVSENPHIDASIASRIEIAGTYRDPDGEQVDVFEQGDGSYLMGSDGDYMPTLFYSLGDDWYLAQHEARESEYLDELGQEIVVYMYTPLTWEEDRLTIFEPVCDQSLSAIPGIEIAENGCGFATREALIEAARNQKSRVRSGALDPGRFVLTRQ
ncbi:MAG TPA: hypothetical protein VLA37_00295 [Sphingomonadaceae bacterium]|nr:hypothetical protein [Sphingomonadaceae bacterium]